MKAEATGFESERQKNRLFWLQMSKTVLLVDDDPEFLSALSPLLNTAGYSVITAKDAKEARSVLDDHRVFINAAIIDLELPEIGGFQIIGELARAQKRPIPIMAVTGRLQRRSFGSGRVSGRKNLHSQAKARPTAHPDSRWPKSPDVQTAGSTDLKPCRIPDQFIENESWRLASASIGQSLNSRND